MLKQKLQSEELQVPGGHLSSAAVLGKGGVRHCQYLFVMELIQSNTEGRCPEHERMQSGLWRAGVHFYIKYLYSSGSWQPRWGGDWKDWIINYYGSWKGLVTCVWCGSTFERKGNLLIKVGEETTEENHRLHVSTLWPKIRKRKMYGSLISWF